MKAWLKQKIFALILWLSNKFASSPKKEKVFDGLSKLMQGIEEGKENKGLVVPFNCNKGRFIIFSDQHKGGHNGADDFWRCEGNYLAALDFYYQNNFTLIALGDCEELWENTLAKVVKHQQPSFERYRKFAAGPGFYKTIGNHDLAWKNDPLTIAQIQKIFGSHISVYDGVLLQTTTGGNELKIFCTHGHQGDDASDGSWFSKFFVSKIWAPLQSLLKINPNTPAYDAHLKTLHNRLMYEWSLEQKNLLLVTGHTHQPVFESLTYIERLYRQLLMAQAAGDEKLARETEAEISKRKFEYNHVSKDYLNMKPGYFNSGCCCYNDREISGLEIEDGNLRLVKWTEVNNVPQRQVLEEESLEVLSNALG
ncbi:MAG TPA: metallophosphoesterase [Flavisolibacter sp.]|jgi:UDP-2,3-diacylglucosamine pyrophosphatase LpxH|nr:metallophosphoesterase [Flavisolibacter sp.]